MHRPDVAIEADEREKEDATVCVDVEGDLFELAEYVYAFEVGPLECHVEGEGEGEDPGGVAQGQVQQENIAGARCFPEAGVVDYSCDVSQDPDRKGKGKENQEDVAVPPTILKLAAEYCRAVQHLWDLSTGSRGSYAT